MLLTAVVASGSASADIVADSADDVCAPAANPCLVTQRVEIVQGSILDFGLRNLVLSDSGELDFLDRSGVVLAGPIVLGGKGINASSGGLGGLVDIEARRGCSAAPARPCLGDNACKLGNCSGTSTCAHDAGVGCATNADCDLGTCSMGSGDLQLTAKLSGNTDSPASVLLVAAGDLGVTSTIDVSGSGLESEGGSITLSAGQGALTISAPLKVSGGGASFGGTADLGAGTDLFLQEAIDARGGDSDGGEVTLTAGRDLVLAAGIDVSSISGAGYGGSIELNADRDLSINGASLGAPTILNALGHKNDEVPASAGDGGEISAYAGRDLSIGQFGYLISRGAIPEGYGGDLTLDAGRSLSMAGLLRSNADGNDGDGGSITLSSVTSLTTDATAAFEVDGGNGGYIEVAAGGALALGGSFDLGARVNGGSAGGLSVSSDANAVVTATVTALKQVGTVDMDACRLTLAADAKINNNTVEGTNTLTSRESMKLLAGSSLTTKGSGENRLIYRSAAKPPVRQGTISPTAVLELDPNLSGCPVCGNVEVDQGETCDDGNTAAGDGCSGDCQLESCIAQTVGGYPAQPLCNDGSECTTDSCNLQTGNCQHVVDCDDKVACTVDSCPSTSCVHTTSAAACSDGNFCNGAEICNALTGCGPGTPPSCNDGVACTVDSCSVAQGTCLNLPNAALCSNGQFCDGDELCSAAAGCLPGNPRICADGFSCTTDSCNETTDVCDHDPIDSVCEDGDECTTNSCSTAAGCVKEPSGLPGCVVTTTTTLPPVLCGDANGNGSIQASDALLTLKTAVGTATCDPTSCDVNDSGSVTASDALAILKAAVGQSIVLTCPPPA